MTHLSLALKESHTRVSDNSVYLSTALNPGVPLFVIGGWGENFHFGAGLTPLPDSSLLVYAAKPQHPLGLVPGDIVLGYDRIPWKQLYKELLAAQLPLSAYSWWGCSESSFIHSMLMSAGLNWHLFDTIDIVKYASGDTVHLSTGYLQGISGSFFCTEQLDVPGIPKPAYDGQHVVSYGIILGTNIGYIYGSAWSGNAQQEFFDAVQALMYTDGLIIDFRINFGGNMFLSNPGLNLLFASPTTTIGFGKRSNPLIREAMVPYVDPSAYVIPGNPQGYTKPIAVLTGPGAVSSGDQVALRMKFHPHVKIFGKSTATAFNAPITISLGNPDWFFRYARSDAYLASNPGVYLTHREFQVDYPVWHTPSAVAQGRDNVVDAARAWIDSSLGIKPVQAFLLQQNYPNPFNSQTGIRYELFNQTGVRLEIYNILGQLVRTLVDEKQPAGHYAVPWNGRDQYGHSLASGVYFYRLRSTEYVETKKLMLLR
ncbi:MAG: T9SS type A sorting domain-containing protein [Ignavibacteriales bacterium]|nr:T9SS type A sorting domain-containing protein [Ignavibacteriales bacterium]